MTRSKSIIGALALCALSICAFGAASASAVTGLTAVKCEEVGPETGKYESSHCETNGKDGDFDTVVLNSTTEVEGTSTEGSPTLRATIGGLKVTVQCSTGHVVGGSVVNSEPSAGVHKATTTASRDTYTECIAMLASKESRTCLVEEVTGPNPGTVGMISTVAIKGENTGVNHQVKISPQAGELFTKFNILKKEAGGNECFFSSTVPVEVKGSVEGEASTDKHSHVTFTEANNGTALKVGGVTANYIDTVGGYMLGDPDTTVGAETFT